MKTKKLALISVYDKVGIETFTQSLVDFGFTILSSGGTAKYLKENGIPVVDTADHTGLAACLGHRVATLHPKIHGGLLADPNNPDHVKEMQDLMWEFIDLVCVDFYPLEEEIENPNATHASIIEKIDIGGPTMVRSGAKGNRIVICNVEDRQTVVDWFVSGEPDSDTFRRRLASKAEQTISEYTAVSATYLSQGLYESIHMEKVYDLKYGENPHQKFSALYTTNDTDPLAISKLKTVYGNTPGFVNQTDIWRALTTMRTIAAAYDSNGFAVPKICIAVKHGNACGVGTHPTRSHIAIEKMLLGDLESVLGAVVVCNFEFTEKRLSTLFQTYTKNDAGWRMLSGIVCSNFGETVIDVLGQKESKTFVMTNSSLESLDEHSMYKGKIYRQLGDDMLVQDAPKFIPHFLHDSECLKYSYGPANASKDEDLLLAWAICSTSNSNTITIVRDGMLIANGVGQQSRVRCAKLAISNGQHTFTLHESITPGFENAVAWSDSFFPMKDGIEVLLNNSIKTICTTLGSKNDEKMIQFAENNGITLITYPDSVARGFHGH